MQPKLANAHCHSYQAAVKASLMIINGIGGKSTHRKVGLDMAEVRRRAKQAGSTFVSSQPDGVIADADGFRPISTPARVFPRGKVTEIDLPHEKRARLGSV